MADPEINKTVTKAIEHINKAIDLMEVCIEETDDEHDVFTDAADLLGEVYDLLTNRE